MEKVLFVVFGLLMLVFKNQMEMIAQYFQDRVLRMNFTLIAFRIPKFVVSIVFIVGLVPMSPEVKELLEDVLRNGGAIREFAGEHHLFQKHLSARLRSYR
ncbi:MAG: hypothetical protein JJU00_15880 [Opitutales bacterium]|nr:hypothetical protein [Opitutales bacterium]